MTGKVLELEIIPKGSNKMYTLNKIDAREWIMNTAKKWKTAKQNLHLSGINFGEILTLNSEEKAILWHLKAAQRKLAILYGTWGE